MNRFQTIKNINLITVKHYIHMLKIYNSLVIIKLNKIKANLTKKKIVTFKKLSISIEIFHIKVKLPLL